MVADVASLIGAYTATSFMVSGPGAEFRIRIGYESRELDALLSQQEVNTWAFVTAYNPGSELMTPEKNEAAMASFRNDVVLARFYFLDGAGVPDAFHGSDWLPEPSLLILGITR